MENGERTPASALRLEQRSGPRKAWRTITVPAGKKKVVLKLERDLPYDGKILAWFTPNAVILQANFKITLKGNIVHPNEEVVIPSMGGRYDIGICGVQYSATVS